MSKGSPYIGFRLRTEVKEWLERRSGEKASIYIKEMVTKAYKKERDVQRQREAEGSQQTSESEVS